MPTLVPETNSANRKLFKNEKSFYFILKAQFILKTFTFLPCFFGYVEKQLDKKCCG